MFIFTILYIIITIVLYINITVIILYLQYLICTVEYKYTYFPQGSFFCYCYYHYHYPIIRMSSGELLLLLLIQLYYMNVIRFLKSFRKTKGQFLISYMCERSICWWDGFGSNNQSITILFIYIFSTIHWAFLYGKRWW